METQSLLTALGVAVFGLVWGGLAINIVKISRRRRNPPSFNFVLNGTHLGRFAGWALVGAAALRVDPWTGWLLLITRIPAVALVAVTFLQRRELRPSPARLLRTVVPLVAGLGLLCLGIAVTAPGGSIDFELAGRALPAASPVAYAANAFVLLCFAVQVAYALPRQIVEAWHKPLGNLRWFQLALLVNYGFCLVYSLYVVDDLVQLVMRTAYGAVFVEQCVLVFAIERGIRVRGERADGSHLGGIEPTS